MTLAAGIGESAAAGFTIGEVDVFYEQGAPKFAGADSLGTAVSP